jgi:ABC-type multidrug transport system fused ATPase/permease subunit
MIKAFSKEKEEIKKLKYYKEMSTHKVDIKLEVLKQFRTLSEQITEGITLLFLGKFILEKQCTLGDYTIFKQYKSEFSMTFILTKTTFQSFQNIFRNWKSFFELYDFPVKIKSLKNYISKKLIGKIKFENVTFSYPLKPNSNILQNLSFDIKPGKIFAICGFSGSGKTTISNLIERFYDPKEGKIYIDDIDIRDYNIEYLRKNIGFVSQEPVLNSGTIEENILYGVDKYKKSDFEEVLKLSNVSNFINDKNLFPDGLKTLVGERGAKISAGQKQRIAIARALMKNAKILIFDEATSALDSESEAQVQNAIDNIVKRKEITIIIIAHRLSTIINADKIAVLNNGRMVETGTHKELMNKNGEYKKLFQKQFVNN